MFYNISQYSFPKYSSIKSYSAMPNKTRVESLNERIHKANELIKSFVEKTKIENIEDKKEDIVNNFDKIINKKRYSFIQNNSRKLLMSRSRLIHIYYELNEKPKSDKYIIPS